MQERESAELYGFGIVCLVLVSTIIKLNSSKQSLTRHTCYLLCDTVIKSPNVFSFICVYIFILWKSIPKTVNEERTRSIIKIIIAKNEVRVIIIFFFNSKIQAFTEGLPLGVIL